MTFRHAYEVYRGYRVPRLQLVEHRRWWFTFSGVLIALSLIGMILGGFRFSIDFVGGAQLLYTPATPVTTDQIQGVLDTYGVTAEIQLVAGGDSVSIRTESLTDLPNSEALVKDLATQAGLSPQDVNVEDIGPTWGQQISRKALRGLLLVLLFIAIYIAWRFEWAMAAGAMVALVHDLVITAGLYALVGREVTPETVIAILTILGFSLYDTVVIYDKIQENTESAALSARLGYVGVVDMSLNQTVMRSVNTSLVVLLPILSLLLFGGSTLKDFAFAMFVGVAIGAYSSIFIAAPILTIVHERQVRRGTARAPQPKTPREKAAARAGASTAVAEDAAATKATAGMGSASARPKPKARNKKGQPAKRKRR
ncbi:MAG: protein translocase subunit SecF [Actinomycetota bacterium]